MEILAPTPEGIARAAAALRAGQVVGMPTETVYGLAGILWDEAALLRIFEAKERPTFDPLIAHLAPEWDLGEVADLGALSDVARERVRRLGGLWPGPLTLVLPKRTRVPDLATSGLPTVAVRVPRHPVAQALLRAAGAPLAAPSANRFGRVSPTRAEHVKAELEGRVGLCLDGGPCEIGLESSIVAVDPDGGLRLLRPGGTPREAIEAAAGVGLRLAERSAGVEAPGMLESHYAPRSPLSLIPEGADPGPGAGRGLLLLRRRPVPEGWVVRPLSEDGDPRAIARELFGGLRELDGLPAVVAETPARPEGLLHAVADRLRRASAR